MVHIVKETLNVSLYNIPIFPELEIESQVIDRVFRTPEQQNDAQNFINRLPESDRESLNNFLNGSTEGEE